jgi:hypothetical protein
MALAGHRGDRGRGEIFGNQADRHLILPLSPLGVFFEGDKSALELAWQALQAITIDGKPSLPARVQYRLLAEDSQYIL